MKSAIVLHTVDEHPAVRTVRCAEHAEKDRVDESIEWWTCRAKNRGIGQKNGFGARSPLTLMSYDEIVNGGRAEI